MELEQFAQSVKTVFSLQDQMRKIAKEARELRIPLKERAAEAEKAVKIYMEAKNLTTCNYLNERLELRTVTRQGSLTRKTLLKALQEYFGSEEDALTCLRAVNASLGSTEVAVLRRFKNRGKAASEPTETNSELLEPPSPDSEQDEDF